MDQESTDDDFKTHSSDRNLIGQCRTILPEDFFEDSGETSGCSKVENNSKRPPVTKEFELSDSLKKVGSSKFKKLVKKVIANNPAKIRRDLKTGKLLISGLNQSSIDEIYSAMVKFSSQLRPASRFTHFVSIPFTHEIVQKNFIDFREKILATKAISKANIDITHFQKPQKLHLTFGILTLLTADERRRAAELLRETILPILEDKPLIVNMEGLETMNDDPKKAHILYGTITDGDKLQEIADKVVRSFAEEGLMETNDSGVKLHVTLLNSLFAVRQKDVKDFRETGDKKKKWPKRKPFDASQIIKDFRDFVFARDLTLPEIHLSDVQKTDPESGYYAATSRVILSRGNNSE